MRIMYDSTSAADIPADAPMVAGYVDGSYKWSAADWAKFPNAVLVRIAATAQTNDGQVLDVENGDALPSEAPGWALERRLAGVDPTVYCNKSNVDAVRREFDRQGVAQPMYWLASYDGDPAIPDGFVAKQYLDQAMIAGQPHYDLSTVADIWPGVDTMFVTKAEFEAWKAAFQQAFVAPVLNSLDAHAAAINHLLADDAVHGNAELAAQITKVGVALGEASAKLEASAANIPQ